MAAWRGNRALQGAVALALGASLVAVPALDRHAVARAATACPNAASSAPASADGFASPYMGHNGANDGTGGELAGWDAKVQELDLEKSMGVKWTFLRVDWSLVEPTQPTAAPPAPISATATPTDPWR